MSLRKIDFALLKIERVQLVCSWIVTLFVTFMLVTDISMRFLFDQPLPASFEISEVLMPYIVMFGFAYALTTNVHVRVTLVTDRLSNRLQAVCEVFSYAVSFVVCAVLAYWSWGQFWESFVIREEILAAIKVPWWVGKFGMPAAFAMLAFRYLILFVQRFPRIR